MKKLPKPRIGDLVRISPDYPNTEAAGKFALVTKTLGIECVVEPVGDDLSDSQKRHGKPWWFPRTSLEVISQCK